MLALSAHPVHNLECTLEARTVLEHLHRPANRHSRNDIKTDKRGFVTRTGMDQNRTCKIADRIVQREMVADERLKLLPFG